MNSNNEKRSIFLPYLEKKTNKEMKRIPRHMHKILTSAVGKTDIPDQQKKRHFRSYVFKDCSNPSRNEHRKTTR